MKRIELNGKASLSLPECWEELNEKQVFFTFRQLSRLFAGELTPFEFQLQLLIELTGYRPGLRFRSYDEEKKENIRHNLIFLAEQLDFIFSVDENKITPIYNFKRNPFGPQSPVYFNRDVTVETNITARQYADCVDLLTAIQSQQDDVHVAERCSLKLVSILQGCTEEEVRNMRPEFVFGMIYWFTSICHFFREHPVFGILYSRSKAETDESKISLGMSEIILYLEKEGYAFVEDKNLIDFFYAQVKALKDTINKAIGNGAKIEDIASATGLSTYNIHRLSNE